jgi:dienelactone hydrolase
MQYRRRDFVKAAFGAMFITFSGCAVHNRSSLRCPSTVDDFVVENNLGPLPVYRCKAGAGPPILLLHELTGMSPSNLSLARCLAKEGFSIFLPLLFGEPGQDRFFAGYLQSCGYGDFECSALSAGSPILAKLREVLAKLIARERSPMGIIGMCMTGALPIALLGGGVEAGVLCQPTLPFNVFFGRPVGKQKEALGLNDDDIDRAKSLRTPLLALRYATDRLSPSERMNTLRDIFQQRIATVEIGGEHQGHSTLAGDLDEDAFADAVNYLKVRLGVEKRSREMKLAKLDGRRCEITAEGQWRAL